MLRADPGAAWKMTCITRWLGLLAFIAAVPGAAATAEPTALLRFEGEVRVLLVSDTGLVVAGLGRDGRAWYAVLDPRTLEVRTIHRFADCHRCALLGGTATDGGRVVLVGGRQETAQAVENGWIVVLDARTGGVLEERILEAPNGRFDAATWGHGKLLLSGEALHYMGARVDGWIVALDGASFAIEAEWPHEAQLPSAAVAGLVLGPEDFLAGGWAFDAASGRLGGWLERLTFKGEPVWRQSFRGESGFEVTRLLPQGRGQILALGHAARVLGTEGRVRSALVLARIATETGTVAGLWRFEDDAHDRMAADALLRPGEIVLLASRTPAAGGPDEAEVVRFREGEGFASLFSWRDGGVATVPSAMARAPEGALLLAGWYRRGEGENGPRGWVARFAAASGGGAGDAHGLVLSLEPAAPGKIRVRLENRGAGPKRVRRLSAATVTLIPGDADLEPGLIGAMPGRPADPLGASDFVVLAPGERMELLLEVEPALMAGGSLRARYSPDFTGRGLGHLILSPPLELAPRGEKP